MIDRSLNYGRHVIESYVASIRHCDTAVDIGAGQGDDLRLVRRHHPSARLLALEAFHPYAQALREQAVEVHSIDIERDRFPFADTSVDIVIANQIMEHLKEVFWVLDQVSCVLKVGGHFIIGVPNLAALHNRMLLALGRQPSPIKNNSAHVRGFTRGDLVRLLDSGFPGGYRLKRFGGSNFYPLPPALAKPLASVFPSLAWGIFLLLEKTKPYEGGFLRYPIEQQLETNFYVGAKSTSAAVANHPIAQQAAEKSA